jgi:hypothetical protein
VLRERPIAPPWLRIVALALFALLLSTFAWSPMLSGYPKTQGGDGGFFHQMLEAARISVVRYHELPLWNAFQCGGVPLWDNPQGIAGAPLAWLTLWTGTTRALELWYVIHSAVGFLSMWIFARHELALSRGASMVASASWAFCGVHNQHLNGGHTVWGPFLYFPLAVFLWRRAEHDVKIAIALGLLVAWTIHEGGVYALTYMLVLLGAETLTRAWPPRRVAHIARAGAIVVAVALSMGATRFLPVVDQLTHHTRDIQPDVDALQWETFTNMFLARTHERGAPGQQYVWPEFGDYLGPFLVALAVIGILVAERTTAWMLALLLFSFALMLGHLGRFAPWSILNAHAYPFKQMRVPSRFVVLVTMFLSAYMGIAIDRLSAIARAFAPKRWGEAVRAAVLGIGLIGVGDMIGVGVQWDSVCFPNPPEQVVSPSTRLYLGGAGLASFIDEPRQNRGRLDCWEEWNFTAGAPLWDGDVPQARVRDDAAVIEVANRTQNTFTIEVDAKRPARVFVNSGYDRGWRTDVGETKEVNRQLVVEVPAGHHRVHLKYWPHGLTLGFVLLAIGTAGIVAYFWWDERQRSRPPQPTTSA